MNRAELASPSASAVGPDSHVGAFVTLADRICQDDERLCADVTAVPVASRSTRMVLCSGSRGSLGGARCWWREEVRLDDSECVMLELDWDGSPEMAAR